MSSTLARVETLNDAVVVGLGGDIDATISDLVLADIVTAVPVETLGAVVDLSKVQYLDSAGIQMLFDLVRVQANRRQGVAFVLPPGAPIAKVIAITHVERVAPIHETVDAALSSLRAIDQELY